MPEGGYPELSPYFAGFLAGLIEAEGCFTITKQTVGYAYRPTMSLALRADDRALLEAVTSRTKLGRLIHTAARRTSRPQVTWTVMAKADCVRLVEILDESRLRGRKEREYAIWRAAVLQWARRGVSGRLKPDEWAPFELWKHELEAAKLYRHPDLDELRYRGTSEPSAGWESFFAGFATGEGCFVLERSLMPRFTIHVRADELPLLLTLQSATGYGNVTGPKPPAGLARIRRSCGRSARGQTATHWWSS